MRIRYGTHALLEAEANALLFESLRGVTSQSAKSDILTPWKENHRREREVLTAGGVADSQVRRGIYGRAYNSQQTHLNSRDGVVAPPRLGDGFDRDTLEDLSGWQFR